MIPPLTFENELSTIAAFIGSSAGLTEAAQFLTPEDFSDPVTRQGWEWISEGIIKGRPVDAWSLAQRWGHHEHWPKLREMIAGAQVLFGEGLFYAATLKDRAKLRKAFLTMERGMEIAATADNFEDARPALEAAMMATFADGEAAADCHIRQAIDGIREEMRNPKESKRIIPTGFSKFDGLFKQGGPTEGNLIIVAGKTGDGKSSWALNVVQNCALRGIPAKVYSLEMDRNDLAVRSSLFFAREAPNFEDCLAQAADMPVWFSDRPDRTMDSVRADIRISALRHGIKIAVVDYLQLAKSIQTKDNRERQVADMSRTLKVAAGESKVLVYALSQLNDEGKLRESRAIEQDADGVVYVIGQGGSHYLWCSKLRRGRRTGDLKDIPVRLTKDGIKLDFDAQNFRFHQAP